MGFAVIVLFLLSSLDQVMAIATLSTCYNNPMVFQGVVKIRKGQSVTLMMDATNMTAVQTIITQYSQEVGVCLCCISSSVLEHFNLIFLSADFTEGLPY